MSSPECQIVEIVGVAGSGKSTLSRNLCQQHPGVKLVPFLDTGRLRHLPYVLLGGRSLPVLLGGMLAKPRLSWREAKLVIYVSGWHLYLRRNAQPGQPAFLLDQGPIYAIGRLLAIGKPFTRGAAFARWRQRMTCVWARHLDRIVSLDAPDEILVSRIGSRTQAHETKDLTQDEGYEFLRRHRAAFESVITGIGACGGPLPYEVDTGLAAIDQVVDDVATELGLVPGDRK